MQTKLVNLRAFQHIFIAIAICIITYLCSYRFYRPVLKVDKFIDEMFQNTMPLNLTRTIAQRGARSFSHTTWVSGKYCLWYNLWRPNLDLIVLPNFRTSPHPHSLRWESCARSLDLRRSPFWPNVHLGQHWELQEEGLNCNVPNMM